MNIEIFELEYLKFILSGVWNFIGFIIILLIITNWMGWLFSAVRDFLKGVKLRYKKLNILGRTRNLDDVRPDILKDEG